MKGGNMGKYSFVLHHESEDLFNKLSLEQRGKLISAIFQYSKSGILPNFGEDPAADMAFASIKSYLDRDKQRYEERCRRNKENALKRWKNSDAIASERKQAHAMDADMDMDKDMDIYNKRGCRKTKFSNYTERKNDYDAIETALITQTMKPDK